MLPLLGTATNPRRMTEPTRLTIRRPDDWHVHLRDGAMLEAVAPYTARQFARAIVMPNLAPPVTSVAAARGLSRRASSPRLPAGSGFTPLMTCYLTDHADPAEIARGFEAGVWAAAKLYPAHATTNSAHGVTDVATLHPALEAMQRIGMPLAGPRRGHRPGRRHLRPRGGVHRARACRARRATSRR